MTTFDTCDACLDIITAVWGHEGTIFVNKVTYIMKAKSRVSLTSACARPLLTVFSKLNQEFDLKSAFYEIFMRALFHTGQQRQADDRY